MPLFGGVSAAIIGLAGLGLSGAQYFKGQKEKQRYDEELSRQRAARPRLRTPQALKDELADAQARSGAVSPAVQMAAQEAQKQQANQIAASQRYAGSGAQAIQAAANATAQSNSILPGLAELQMGYDLQNRNSLTNARGASIEDSRTLQQDALNRNQAAQQYSLGRIGAAQNDKSQALALGLSALGTAANIYGTASAIKPNPGLPITQPVAGGTGSAPAAGVLGGATSGLQPTTSVAASMPTTGSLDFASSANGLTPTQIAYLRRLGYNI